MEEKELRELLRARLHMELQLFKDSMLQEGKEDIFQASCRIEIYIDLYEIVLAHVVDLQGSMIRELLGLGFGILDHLYQEWMDREDRFYEELKEYACNELEAIPGKVNWDAEQEEKNGTEPDQAA